jgi:hypothetical protein
MHCIEFVEDSILSQSYDFGIFSFVRLLITYLQRENADYF